MYKGQLEDFPNEVVEKMLERQVEQGNPRDVSVFENRNNENKRNGGFNWSETIEGSEFWIDVINRKIFNTFFELYQNKESLEQERDRLMKRLKEIEELINNQ